MTKQEIAEIKEKRVALDARSKALDGKCSICGKVW